MTDTKQCRANAGRCIDMANSAADAGIQEALFAMAETWLKLADYVERVERVRSALHGLVRGGRLLH
jgi:hypothetical protein